MFPAVVQVPAGESLVASCSAATGGSGGDGQVTPTPAGSGGYATELCLAKGHSGSCVSGATALVVAGGGGGAGDQGQAGGSAKGCFGGCLPPANVGPIGSGFQAGAGGGAGLPLVPFGTQGSVASSGGYPGGAGTFLDVSFCIKLFSLQYCPNSSAVADPGGTGASSGGSGPWQDGKPGAAGSACNAFRYDSAGGFYWLEGGSGGGGAGYAGGQAGTGGSGSCNMGGGISCGLGCWGLEYAYGWSWPGGGGGGGSSWAGGALGAGYGWANPAPGSAPQGETAYTPGGAILLGTWPAKSLTGPMVVSSAKVGTSTWSS